MTRKKKSSLPSMSFSSRSSLARISWRIQAATSALQQQDKALELQANRINTQHEAVQTELDVVQKVIAKNIQSSFKLMG